MIFIYLDSPFFSNRNYEVIWGDEAEAIPRVYGRQGGASRSSRCVPRRPVNLEPRLLAAAAGCWIDAAMDELTKDDEDELARRREREELDRLRRSKRLPTSTRSSAARFAKLLSDATLLCCRETLRDGR